VIAISYRRSDTKPVAGRIYDVLQSEFGKENVFMDFDSIPYGVDFRAQIDQILKKARVVVAIIGPDWVGQRAGTGRRIDDETDFVRLEVVTALRNRIPIIPVLVDKTSMPDPSHLPRDIADFAFCNGLDLDTGIDFHHHADRLVAGIRRVLESKGDKIVPVTKERTGSEKPRTRLIIRMFSLLGLVVLIVAGFLFLRNQGVKEPVTPQVSPTPTASEPGKVLEATARPAASATIAPPVPKIPARPPFPSSATEEKTYLGRVGDLEATFRLRFDSGGRVSGSYTDGGNTYRLVGHDRSGRLLLDEYTGDRLTAHLDVTLNSSQKELRWEGRMQNVYPNTQTYPVFFAQPR